MSRILGTTTPSSSGLHTVSLGFMPTWATFKVCARKTGEVAAHTSEGKVYGTYQFCQSTFSDASGSMSYNSPSFVVQHYERISGTITKVLSISFDSFVSNGISWNVDIPSSDYQVLIEAGN